MSSEDIKILEFKQDGKSNKTPPITYADLGSFNINIDGRKNNFEKLHTTKVGEHTPRWYSISTKLTLMI